LRDVRIFPEKNNRKEQMIGCLYAFSLMFLIISGCGIRTTPELISGDANTVSFLAGADVNPGPAAVAYCGQSGKSAVFVSSQPVQGGMNLIYTFNCR